MMGLEWDLCRIKTSMLFREPENPEPCLRTILSTEALRRDHQHGELFNTEGLQ
jgi:hypothetical protein